MEGQERLELSTPCLRGRCSNQLSYWPIILIIPKCAMNDIASGACKRQGHILRPPNFAIDSVAVIGRFVSELPLAVLTLTS